MIIIGAGLTGLICGALNPRSTIYEKSRSPVSNHNAILRFKSDQLARLLGIPFTKVKVQKSIWYHGREVPPSPKMTNRYSLKVIGKIRPRSISDISTETRYIPPENFYNLLLEKCNIIFNSDVCGIDSTIIKINNVDHRRVGTPIVSTLPMPMLANATDIQSPQFLSPLKVFIYKMNIPQCEAYSTIYYPGSDTKAYRASLNRGQLIIESRVPLDIPRAIDPIFRSFGIPLFLKTVPETFEQKSGKISSIDSNQRKEFIYQNSIQHKVYSLGRFATWRPKLMLDDVVDDILVIRRLIEEGNYAATQHNQED